MTTPKSYLFAIIDGGGTVPADTSVIRAMVERGHDVRVLADRVLAPDIEATGAEHVAVGPRAAAPEPRSAERDHQRLGREDAVPGLRPRPRRRRWSGRRASSPRTCVTSCSAARPTWSWANFFVFGAQIAAEAEGVPFAFLVSNLLSFPGSGTPPLGPGPEAGPRPARPGARRGARTALMARLFDKGLDRLNEVRSANGVAPVASVLESFERADRLLLMTSRAFEYETFSPPPNVRLVGPRLDDPAWAGEWTPPAGDDPLVLVGMSSTFMDHAEVLQRATSALGDLPVRGLVTTGPAIPVDAIDAPANVTVVRRAPHSEVLRHASAVVTHAGHGTVIKSLAAGVPVVAVPLGRDQLDNAARVAHHGAGLRLKPKASSDAIARAVRRVLDEPSYRANAERLATAIASETSQDLAAEELEDLAKHSRSPAPTAV